MRDKSGEIPFRMTIPAEKKTILITGGTSGLGLNLVRLFLAEGYHVVTTGRRTVSFPGYEESFTFYRVDFSNLVLAAAVFKAICFEHEIDVLINNAGVLSPVDKKITEDDLEYTYQVNFLAHLLLDILVINNKKSGRPLKIVSVTSPVYRIANLREAGDVKAYIAAKAYSQSKLYLAIMCRHLKSLFPDGNFRCFSFDPGIFGSGIYRMRGKFFSFLYRIASPFMRRSSTVARRLVEYILMDQSPDGVIVDFRRRIRRIPEFQGETEDKFWNECQAIISGLTG